MKFLAFFEFLSELISNSCCWQRFVTARGYFRQALSRENIQVEETKRRELVSNLFDGMLAKLLLLAWFQQKN